MELNYFLRNAPRHLFFTGKGGVGKTSLACAAAVQLSGDGRRVLLVSTDPASNLDAVLETPLGSSPRRVEHTDGLDAFNIDPAQAALDYRERTIAPYRDTLPPGELELLEERLSGACTMEVAAFDEFALLLSEPERTDAYDHVIFDTAPTGHTLRLLELPAAWTGFLEHAPGDVSCLGPMSGLKTQRDRYAIAVAALGDPSATVIVLVARPDRVALLEAARTRAELENVGIANHVLVINAVFHATDRSDPLARAFEDQGKAALGNLPLPLATLPRADVALRSHNLVGLSALRELLQPVAIKPSAPLAFTPPESAPLSALTQEIAAAGHGLVLVMGKGGVGKTTVAAALAVDLADRGLPVHLTTTDPAQHLRETLPESLQRLRVTTIDPKLEAARYRERSLAAARDTLGADKLALLEEELKSPCYEEVAVFQAFSRVLIGGRREFVVIDTAPTGHTMLLLDTAGAYHRQMTSGHQDGARVRTPLMLLQDPNYARVIVVTLPETTPVLEAESLQDDLRRAGIEPFAWVVNASLAIAEPRDQLLRARAAAELPQIRRVRETLARRVALVPFQIEPPVGVDRLRALTRGES